MRHVSFVGTTEVTSPLYANSEIRAHVFHLEALSAGGKKLQAGSWNRFPEAKVVAL